MPSSPGFRRRGDRASEPASIGQVLEDLLREEQFVGGLTVGRLASVWAQVVGPRLASATAPTALEKRVLTVAASSGPWGAQAQFLAEEIRRRTNETLGGEPVEKVIVVVRPER
jgi:predicted nucleic acid-binding Zn ribbon protein